jgi:hypothetical protein
VEREGSTGARVASRPSSFAELRSDANPPSGRFATAGVTELLTGVPPLAAGARLPAGGAEASTRDAAGERPASSRLRVAWDETLASTPSLRALPSSPRRALRRPRTAAGTDERAGRSERRRDTDIRRGRRTAPELAWHRSGRSTIAGVQGGVAPRPAGNAAATPRRRDARGSVRHVPSSRAPGATGAKPKLRNIRACRSASTVAITAEAPRLGIDLLPSPAAPPKRAGLTRSRCEHAPTVGQVSVLLIA